LLDWKKTFVALPIAFNTWVPSYWSMCNKVASRAVYLGTLLTPQIDYLGTLLTPQMDYLGTLLYATDGLLRNFTDSL